MNAVSTQEDIDIFSSDPSGVKERPGNPYYQDGVDVGYTAPAKWWNWLWNKITSILTAHKADWNSMTSEMANTLSAASITPDSSDAHQLSKAVNQIAYNTCDDYDNEEVTETIGGVEVTHKVNQPYVVGHTLYIPDTELL
jgi:hypothetical protein